MHSFIICVTIAAFVVAGEAKTIAEVRKCKDDNMKTCRTQCITEIPEANRAAVEQCFVQKAAAVNPFETCLKDAGYGPDAECFKCNHDEGKKGSRGHRHGDGSKSRSWESLPEVVKKFKECKHKCLDALPTKCDEGCKDSKDDTKLREVLKSCRSQKHDGKGGFMECLKNAVQ